MMVATGVFTSDGNRRTILCVDELNRHFKPAVFFTRASTADYFAFYSEDLWCGRSNTWQADSFLNGIRFARVPGSSTQWNIHLGTDSKVNGVAGTVHYYFVLGESTDNDLELTSFQGNQTAGRVLDLLNTGTQLATIIKRDSTLAAIIRGNGVGAAIASGGASADASALVLNTPAGKHTISDMTNVNEYDALTKGEGINALTIFSSSPNVELLTWTGNATAGRVIPSSFPLKAALTFSTSGSTSGRFITDQMTPEQGSNYQNTALSSLTNVGHVASDGLHLTTAAPNASGVTYYALVFGSSAALTPKTPPVFAFAGRKAVHLNGSSSKIECGSSDATLKFDGACAKEWLGALFPNNFADGGHAALMVRCLDNPNTAGNCSWGLLAGAVQSGTAYWSGHQICVVTKDRIEYGTPIPDGVWRTGIILPYGEIVHIVVVHDGLGGWKLFVNGVLKKQRAISVSPNIASGVGHRTLFGAQSTTSSGITNSQQSLHMLGRVYTRALTNAEVLTRFRIAYEGSAESDISSSGLAESWDAANASGTSFPATVNAANDGVITNGTVVNL
jgi:hypothetical protein